MRLPRINTRANAARQYVVNFGSLNLSSDYVDGELAGCLNLGWEHYPRLSPRRGREVALALSAPGSVFSKDNKLAVVDGTTFYFDGVARGTVAPGRKYMAGVGGKIVIWPDKLYYDVEDGVLGSLEARVALAAGTVSFAGTNTLAVTGGGGDVFGDLAAGDAVTVTGCSTLPGNNVTAIVREVAGDSLIFDENLFTEGAEAGAVTVSREAPELDYICESNNRIWGCCGQTIRGSALGDPFNFNVFDGLATDSYALEVGTDGEFTGCVPFSTQVLFFKERYVHKLYGSRPDNYQLMTKQIEGVRPGAERSMVVVNELLYYQGYAGVYAYSGGVPELISARLGTAPYGPGVAGTDGERYYISMAAGGAWGLYVYDINRDLWLMEDGIEVADMCRVQGVLHFAAGDSVYAVTGAAEVISWSATLVPMDEVMHERKGLSRLALRVQLAAGASIQVQVAVDGGAFVTVAALTGAADRVMQIPIFPNRCDRFQIRVAGTGAVQLHSLERRFQIMSEV